MGQLGASHSLQVDHPGGDREGALTVAVMGSHFLSGTADGWGVAWARDTLLRGQLARVLQERGCILEELLHGMK